jgi:hypothetical protein
MKQKNLPVRCTVNVSGLQLITSSKFFPQTHSLPEVLGCVHIGQVGSSELPAQNLILNSVMLIGKKLTRKCTKRAMMFRCQTLHTYSSISIALLLELIGITYDVYIQLEFCDRINTLIVALEI